MFKYPTNFDKISCELFQASKKTLFIFIQIFNIHDDEADAYHQSVLYNILDNIPISLIIWHNNCGRFPQVDMVWSDKSNLFWSRCVVILLRWTILVPNYQFLKTIYLLSVINICTLLLSKNSFICHLLVLNNYCWK